MSGKDATPRVVQAPLAVAGVVLAVRMPAVLATNPIDFFWGQIVLALASGRKLPSPGIRRLHTSKCAKFINFFENGEA
jgi:hypothetical protein